MHEPETAAKGQDCTTPSLGTHGYSCISRCQKGDGRVKQLLISQLEKHDVVLALTAKTCFHSFRCHRLPAHRWAFLIVRIASSVTFLAVNALLHTVPGEV